MTDKWICKRCGREHPGKPEKNEICNADGCKGRFQQFHSCQICGRWFKTHGRTVCPECSAKGYAHSRGGSVELVCMNCGKTFRRPRANATGKKQFCGIECMRAYEQTRWTDRICKQCGKHFRVRISSIEKSNASGNYCSRFCYDRAQHLEGSRAWKGGFERVKRKFFSGVQFCAICGTTKKIHIHHIIPFRYTQDNSVENLIPLCAGHHSQVEQIWKPFFEMFDNPADAGPYVSSVLRARQRETMSVIRRIMERGQAHDTGRMGAETYGGG